MAEREGFEPSVPRWGHTHFPGEPVRPLRHLSQQNTLYLNQRSNESPIAPVARDSGLYMYRGQTKL